MYVSSIAGVSLSDCVSHRALRTASATGTCVCGRGPVEGRVRSESAQPVHAAMRVHACKRACCTIRLITSSFYV